MICGPTCRFKQLTVKIEMELWLVVQRVNEEEGSGLGEVFGFLVFFLGHGSTNNPDT